MRIGVIGAPSSAGAYAPGQELAPGHLRKARLLDRLEQIGVVAHDRGDLTRRRWSPDRSSRRAQNIDGVVATIQEVRTAVMACVEDAERPLVLGGDCTVGLGTVAALDEPGLVYLDLHADMNVPSSTPDGALDWMVWGTRSRSTAACPPWPRAASCTATRSSCWDSMRRRQPLGNASRCAARV